MKKRWAGLLALVLAVIMLGTGTAGSLPGIGSGAGTFTQSGGYNTQAQGTTSFTLMVYMVGSDLESKYGLASDDIQEMAQSGANFGSVNVVIAAGGASGWRELSVAPGETAFGSLKRGAGGQMALVWDQRLRATIAAPSTLSAFLNYAYTNFPAQNYALVLWDHGGGPMVGFGHDEAADTILRLPDLVRGLQGGPFTRKNLGVIAFDACLMGSYEVASALAPYAELMVASEEVTPGTGFDYTFLGRANLNNSLATATAMCDAFFDAISWTGRECSMAVIALDNVRYIDNILQGIFGQNLTQQDRVQLAQAAGYSKAFGVTGTNSTYDLYDFYEFLSNLCYLWGTSDTESLLRLAKTPVYYLRSSIAGANGLSFYFPLYTNPNRVRAVETYSSLNLNGSYLNYMKGINAGQASLTGNSGNPLRTYDGTSRVLLPQSKMAEEGASYTWQMTPEQQERFVRASYVVLRTAEEGSYDLLRGGYGVRCDESGLLTATVSPLLATAAGEPITMIEKERTEDRIVYFLPFLLERDGQPQLVNAQYTVTAEGAALGEAVPYEDSGVAPRQLITLGEGDWVSFQLLRYTAASDEAGNLLPFQDWSLSDTVYATGETLGAENPEPVKRALPPEGEYWVQIICTDIEGAHFCSPLMPLAAE